MGYNLCKMGDFQNGLISQIFRVFSRFIAQNNSNGCFCRMVFRIFLEFLIFDPNWPFCKAIAFPWAITFARWLIFKKVSFLQHLVFFRAVFCTEHSVFVECSFCMFLAFWIFDPNWPFFKGYSLCMGYSLCKVVDFQIGLISRIY